ncbi:MAG TPA: hypothetical protein VMS31_22145 [Pyrinomonadaceae bacterium]|nr:hypothetical protein [Pyrinomonadaceae bacterium]
MKSQNIGDVSVGIKTVSACHPITRLRPKAATVNQDENTCMLATIVGDPYRERSQAVCDRKPEVLHSCALTAARNKFEQRFQTKDVQYVQRFFAATTISDNQHADLQTQD